MKRTLGSWAVLAVAGILWLTAFSCSDSSSPADGDTEADSEQSADGDSDTPVDGDSDVVVDGDSEAADGESVLFDGFSLRIPQSRSLTCSDDQAAGGQPWYDVDYVCRVAYESLEVELYLQATPSDCYSFGAPIFVADHQRLWIKQNGAISEAPSGSFVYDYGGRHHNDSLSFTVAGQHYTLWHSSMGWGGRVCTSPDCLLICKEGLSCAWGETDSIAVNGCSREAGSGAPATKILCEQVAADGSVPAFLDLWSVSDGSTDAPLLPCGGDSGMAR